MTRQVHILGGASGIGRWLAEKVFSSVTKTFCYDISTRYIEQLPPSIQRCHLDSTTGFSSYADNFKTGDWIIFAVPQPVLNNSVESIIPFIKAGSLLVVSTSTQKESLLFLRKNTPINCECFGFHPLFGPTVTSPVGQLAALTEFDNTKPRHIKFRKVLNDAGLVVSILSAEEHDNCMALVQALTHFCLIGFATTIGANGVRPADLLKLKTPNFQFLFAFSSRVLKLSTTTTGSIQYTPEAKAIRESYISSLTKLHDALSASTSVETAASVIEQARMPLAGAEVEEGVETAAVAVDSLQQFEEQLHLYRVNDMPFAFHHRTTGKIHIVRIVEIRHNEIDYEESTKQFKINGTGKIAIGLFDTARNNYRKAGISLAKQPHKATIRKRNIRLLNPQEFRDFYKDKILPIKKLIDLRNPHDVKEDFIEELLPLVIIDLWKCEFVERYQERIKIVAHFNPNIDISRATEQISQVVEERKLTSRSRGTPAGEPAAAP